MRMLAVKGSKYLPMGSHNCEGELVMVLALVISTAETSEYCIRLAKRAPFSARSHFAIISQVIPTHYSRQ